ncbi:MAG TPA: aldo/keto reductase [Thermotogota bacterium]|nr:aldo/keto reductase [Thermotogota bacterium]HPR96033.1 aldo/keto reductase [Thermotogota bacterium]
MLYREFGRTGEKVSILGFGCMRFQVMDNDPKKIIEEKAIEQVRHAIDRGVNYIDTAYPYHGGMSEPVVAKALKDGYREKVFLATKLPSWLVKTREDMDKLLNEQLEKLQTDHIDFYLIHALNKGFWENLKKCDVFDFMDKVRKDGRVRHIGFSFHDELPLFKEIVDAYDWEFCQIQYNFMDENYQAGLEGLTYASDKGLGVVIMEPLRGGSLVRKIPEDIQAIWDKAEIRRSPAEWALKFIWDHREVSLILSGMNEMAQVDENIDSAEDSTPGMLTDKERVLISEARDVYLSRIKVNCTACKYCMPCPFGVDIPMNFSLYNDASIYLDYEGQKTTYQNFFSKEQWASKCQECGACETHCPQHIKIRDRLKEVAAFFEG